MTNTTDAERREIDTEYTDDPVCYAWEIDFGHGCEAEPLRSRQARRAARGRGGEEMTRARAEEIYRAIYVEAHGGQPNATSAYGDTSLRGYVEEAILAAMEQYAAEIVAAERERCAKAVEDAALVADTDGGRGLVRRAVAAIREQP